MQSFVGWLAFAKIFIDEANITETVASFARAMKRKEYALMCIGANADARYSMFEYNYWLMQQKLSDEIPTTGDTSHKLLVASASLARWFCHLHRVSTVLSTWCTARCSLDRVTTTYNVNRRLMKVESPNWRRTVEFWRNKRVLKE